jgi:hypothetical protein
VKKEQFDSILKYAEAAMKFSPRNDGVPLTWDEMEKGIMKVLVTATTPQKL